MINIGLEKHIMTQKLKNRLRNLPASHSEPGFTLVETMAAIVVLSIGFLAAASMQISAVNANSSANRMTNAINLAQSRLEELMALEYSQVLADPDLTDDNDMIEEFEPYTDLNGNGLRDFKEPYTDSNGNGVWDAAHVDPNPPPGYMITWSVTDNMPTELAKYIRIFVTEHGSGRTLVLTGIKSRE